MLQIKLPELPYSPTALQPILSEESFRYHYGKHHQGYIDKFNKLIATDENSKKDYATLEQVIKRESEGALFNNAAQAWNHTFYWHSLAPGQADGSSRIPQALQDAIVAEFGDLASFKEEWVKEGTNHFASGWLWLTYDTAADKIFLVSTHDAENPMRNNLVPLLTTDLWEHAYYIDYQNDRAKFLNEVWTKLNWTYAGKNFDRRNQGIQLTDEMRK